MGAWYPAHPGTINRFLAVDAQSRERLVVVPGQFLATSPDTPTVGIQRLYSDLEFEVYHAPVTATDYVEPSIWQVEAISTSVFLRFRVMVEDDSGTVARTVVLYREEEDTSWTKVELEYNAVAGFAEAFVPPVSGQIYYFVQAVDPTGNVALVLDHETPFVGPVDGDLWDPTLPRDLSVLKTASASTLAEGDVFTYTIVVENTGLGMLSKAVVSDTLPAGLVMTGPVTLEPPDAGTMLLPSPYLVHDLIIAPMEAVTITFPVQALDGFVRITNTVAVTSAEIPVPMMGMVVLTVTNLPPVVTNPGPQTNAVSDTVSLAIEASDVASDTLVYSANGLPSGLSISPAMGLISGTLGASSVGVYTVTVEVSDYVSTTGVTFSWIVTGDQGAQIYLPLVVRNHTSVLDLGSVPVGDRSWQRRPRWRGPVP
jgi:uncharacterized repeat protein (TIGR01451 family)